MDPYAYPRITRSGIVSELRERAQRAAERGDKFLSWSLDISCSEEDLIDVDSPGETSDDVYWDLYLDTHKDKASTMLEDACKEVSDKWEETDARYHWTSYDKDEGRLYLKGIYQTKLVMSERHTMDDILSNMSDEYIVEFWANCRKLDVDTSEEAVKKSILDKISPFRTKLEMEWSDNPSTRYALGEPRRQPGVSY